MSSLAPSSHRRRRPGGGAHHRPAYVSNRGGGRTSSVGLWPPGERTNGSPTTLASPPPSFCCCPTQKHNNPSPSLRRGPVASCKVSGMRPARNRWLGEAACLAHRLRRQRRRQRRRCSPRTGGCLHTTISNIITHHHPPPPPLAQGKDEVQPQCGVVAAQEPQGALHGALAPAAEDHDGAALQGAPGQVQGPWRRRRRRRGLCFEDAVCTVCTLASVGGVGACWIVDRSGGRRERPKPGRSDQAFLPLPPPFP